ncbi:MAG: TadE/TadG family type IV pilus assembly protein [Caulobacteraceae bacterium]
MSIWRRFGRDRRGVAAIEFALIAPVMVLMYCGLVELCQAMIAERKANHVASAIGDLVAQVETVSTGDLSDIFSIGQTIMSPYNTGTLQMRVTSVTLDSTGKPKVTWTRSNNWTASTLKVGDQVTLPVTLNPGDSIIMSESKYSYTSIFHYVLPKALNYNEAFYLRPRRSDNVTCTGC